MSDECLKRFSAYLEEKMLGWPFRERIKLRRIMRDVTVQNGDFFLAIAFLIDMPVFLDHVEVRHGEMVMRKAARESMQIWAAVQGPPMSAWIFEDRPEGLAEAA